MAYFVLDANDSSDPGTECESLTEAQEVVREYQKKYRGDFRIVYPIHERVVGYDHFRADEYSY